MIKIYQIAYKNLLRKKTRTALTMLGIALSTWVLLSLFGFNRGFQGAMSSDIDKMGYQLLVTAKGCPYEAATLMLKGGTGLRYMNDSVTGAVRKNNEVEDVTPMLMHAIFDPNKGESGGFSAYLGIDPLSFPGMKAYMKFASGGWFKSPDAYEAVLGYEAAELEQREVGDSILIPDKNIEIKVVGILKRTGTQDDGTIFIPIKTVQQIFALETKLTGIGIKVKKDADINALEQRLYDLPDVQVVSLAQVKETIFNLVGTAKVMVLSIAIIAVLIAMIGVINTILMSVIERFQEIGILKSLGALPSDIFKLIVSETIILCVTGGLVGSILAYILSGLADLLIRRILPYAPTGKLILIDPLLSVKGLLLIILVGVASGLYPAWKAARVRPIESIKAEGGR